MFTQEVWRHVTGAFVVIVLTAFAYAIRWWLSRYRPDKFALQPLANYNQRRGHLLQLLTTIYAIQIVALTFTFARLGSFPDGSLIDTTSTTLLFDALPWFGMGLYTVPAGLLCALIWIALPDSSKSWQRVCHDAVFSACLLVVLSIPGILAVIYGASTLELARAGPHPPIMFIS